MILAPTRNDARLTADFLDTAGLRPNICQGLEDLRQRVQAGCGAILVAEEVLGKESVKILADLLREQPSWSDLPIVIITGTREAWARHRHLSALTPTGNVSIIERPVRPDTLVSTLESAIRSRQRQYQVKSLLEEREKMTLEALEADRRKDEFLAMLAHELRNPLASVANATALLKSSSDQETLAWSTGVIERQTHQLTHIIDDLLDVSRITTGKIRLRRSHINMAVVLDRACDSALPLMAERGHRFTCDYPKLDLWLEADPTRIEQVVLNLLANAAKYTPKNGCIQLTAINQGADILVIVKDNGIGIEPKRLPEMFQLFTQGERSIARSEGGLGIGLTIVQKLTEMHDGQVDAHSDGPGLGSTFSIRLPATVPQKSATLMGDRELRPKLISKRVLVVDDNVDSAVGLAKLLTRAGHQVALAYDGTEALAQAQLQSSEAIVLDIGLPGMDGYEVARLLRQETWGRQALLIAVTGYGQEEDKQRAMDAGFDHHLVKPVDLTRLKSLLRVSPEEPAVEQISA
ncbi:ATP-binding response regulator [Prosthecobacter dejongeii]|uniref:ATP-binding response regulator n=1 Tax=Prosthecobacter dejongeii TaxID=48465 RepID=UPI00161D4880|nr:ATP-binding protein [Prosthecobacter dejongeii]